MRIFLSTFFVFYTLRVFCQTTDPYEEKYQWRIQQEVLYGVYIPKDVNDALLQLNKLIDKESKAKFKAMDEEQAVHKLFFSLGRWMTHNWSLYDGSRLSVHLQNMGIHHPDDMCMFLIRVYHRSLNKKELGIKELLEDIAAQEEARKAERRKKGVIIYEEKRKVPKEQKAENGN
jgi:hypothetical protein